MRAMMFRDRRQAGQVLARHLLAYRGRPDVIVLALPRGGVPVGFEVARALGVPLDVFIVRKLGVPGYPELAMGAIASGGVRVLSRDLVARLAISHEALDAVTGQETTELARRELLYRGGRPPHALSGMTVILVDDGLATGSTMRAAVEAVRKLGALHIVTAVPVAAPQACGRLDEEADECVCVAAPPGFGAVGEFYSDFEATSDDEVRTLLAAAAEIPAPAGSGA
jgi:predicted phosphoribosyltransferase